MDDYFVPQVMPFVGREEIANLTQVINNKWLTEGPFSKDFIAKIKNYTGAPYAVLANNGTLGLFLSLLASNIGPGDEVIVPDLTFIASATSVMFCGAKPVFVDVEADTWNIDTTLIEQAITERTKAIMPVHLYGQSADMGPVLELARRYNLKIIEDAAQGYGVFYKGTHTGVLGDVGVISFFADKTITSGEGAVILTHDQDVFNRLSYLRNQGRLNSGTFIHPFLGMNFRLTDLQAAIGVAQIEKFPMIVNKRLENYQRYQMQLEGIPGLKFLAIRGFSNLVPFRFNLIVDDLAGLITHLENNRIQTRGVFFPLHRQPCLQQVCMEGQEFPNADYASAHGLSLPVYNDLTIEQIDYVCSTIKDFVT